MAMCIHCGVKMPSFKFNKCEPCKATHVKDMREAYQASVDAYLREIGMLKVVDEPLKSAPQQPLRWRVVGGSEQGGVLVGSLSEKGAITTGKERLATGSIVIAQELKGLHLLYELLDGAGPPQGWVKTHEKRQQMLVPVGYEPVQRNLRLPGYDHLPDIVRATLPPRKPRAPRTRVVCLSGTADPYTDDWYIVEEDAPEFLEVIPYEWPGVGLRRHEPLAQTLSELADDAWEALKGVLGEGVPFVFVAFSMGCRILCLLAERAKRELNVEPLAVICLDFGPPHMPIFSEYGMEQFRNHPEKSVQVKWPHLVAKGPAMKNTLNVMHHTYIIAANQTIPVGFHRFTCPLVAVIARRGYLIDELYTADTPPDFLDEREKYFDGTKLNQWKPKDFEGWADWAALATIVDVDCDHFKMQRHPEVEELIWSVCGGSTVQERLDAIRDFAESHPLTV
eukprot:TRINITY_DN42969_c0_g1_i1.p1 TRINITY_DN42969_c0_g1~~TRINITY_DN42969_c0_g1_i1.p1  ORF type:complete len:450 (+),score=74.17 TRINITY_DN42969_c0_g1_i1:80-1429(+)